MGRFFLNVMAGFAELERNLIAERTETALAHKRAHLEAYAPTPYGYDRVGDKLTLNAEEQRVIQYVLAMRRAGASLAKIARDLTAQGIPTKRDRKWYPSTVSYILQNTLYEGAA
jgi:DNA invertase Pin-like site-specific DNA recombinase